MREALIQGIVCTFARAVRFNAIPGAFLLCHDDGNPSTTEAIAALALGGHVVYDSRSDLASTALAALKNYDFVEPGQLWAPAYDEEEPPNEIPRNQGGSRFVVVVRDVAVFHARWRPGTRRTVLWGLGDIQDWGAALGALVIASGQLRLDTAESDVSGGVLLPRKRDIMDLAL